MTEVPEIDIGPLLDGDSMGTAAIGGEIDAACREVGFFQVVGHRVDPDLRARLDERGREFFALSEHEKQQIAMSRAGRSWRGWFPVGGELTAGVPDLKEGLYFGTEHDPDDPRVEARTPLHGPNQFPRNPSELRSVVLRYLDEMARVGQAVLRGMAVGLGLDPSWFAEHLTGDPTVLFRIFHYPPAPVSDDNRWGVAEHTDYGLLTLLGQDSAGGLQIRTPGGWIDAAPHPDGFVCNIGDMLERLTGGRYRSTPHRVRNASGRDRLSFPFFLDPSWHAVVDRLPIVERPLEYDAAARWDHTSVQGFTGTYGQYLVSKVGKVFPDLAAESASDSAAGPPVGSAPA